MKRGAEMDRQVEKMSWEDYANQESGEYGLSRWIIDYEGIEWEPAEPEPTEEAEEVEAAPEEAPMDMTPGVSFIAPEEGSTVSSPVTLEFGHEHFTIEPITDPLTVHEGAGHHHIGLDTDCLPAGEIIPQASPWVHFGDGSNTIEMQLEPGPHRVCLQIGDGEHRTLEGMSAEVTFTVE